MRMILRELMRPKMATRELHVSMRESTVVLEKLKPVGSQGYPMSFPGTITWPLEVINKRSTIVRYE